MTDTVPLTVLAMYAHGLLTRIATDRGSFPTGTSCSLVRRPSLPTWKNVTVLASVLTATIFRPSGLISIGLDLSARGVGCWGGGWHLQAGSHTSAVCQAVALLSHCSPSPVSTTPSPQTDVAAVKCAGACPLVLRVPVKTEQPWVMRAFTLTLALTPVHLPFGKAITTAVPFFCLRSLA